MVRRLKRSFNAPAKKPGKRSASVGRKQPVRNKAVCGNKTSVEGRGGRPGKARPDEMTLEQESASKYASVRMIDIDAEDAGQRVDNFLVRILKGVPKTRIYRIIRKGEVRVNKKRVAADYRIQDGDRVRVPPVRLAEKGDKVRPAGNVLEKLEDAIIYEDSRLIVVNKPSGLAVHGGSGLSYGLIEALRQIRPDNRTLELVHRLDRDTSGCLVIAKRRSMLRHLHNLLQQKHKVQKVYHALVAGKWPARKLLVNAPLQRNVLQSGERMVRVDMDGKQSRTEYQVLERYQKATLVKAKPITGRTHQIRVHCLHGGHAILGDDKYGRDEDNLAFRGQGLKRLFLHAASIEFETPEGETLKIEAPLPDDLQNVLDSLDKA